MSRGFKERRNHAWKQFDDDEMTEIAARTCLKHGSRVVNRDKAARKNHREAAQAKWSDWTGMGRGGQGWTGAGKAGV